MPVSARVENYLIQANVDYQVVHHNFSHNAQGSASAAHVPLSKVMKSVLLKETLSDRFVLAIIPARNKLKIPWVNNELNRNLAIADEIQLAFQFPDCILGAVPAIGQAYNMDIIWDEQLASQPDLYFEGGDHQELIHITKAQFSKLFQPHPHSLISLPSDSYSLYHADEIRSGLN